MLSRPGKIHRPSFCITIVDKWCKLWCKASLRNERNHVRKLGMWREVLCKDVFFRFNERAVFRFRRWQSKLTAVDLNIGCSLLDFDPPAGLEKLISGYVWRCRQFSEQASLQADKQAEDIAHGIEWWFNSLQTRQQFGSAEVNVNCCVIRRRGFE